MSVLFDCVQMELTNRCQLDCAECPRRYMTRPIGDMRLDLAKILIEDALEYNPKTVFNLNGLGEPLLYPKMEEFLVLFDKIAPKGIKVDLFTNLSLPIKKLETIFKLVNGMNRPFMIATTNHLYNAEGKKEIPTKKFYDDGLFLVHQLTKDNPKIDLHSHIVIHKYHNKKELDSFLEEKRKFLPYNKVHTSDQLIPWFDTVKDMAGPAGAYYITEEPKTGEEICYHPFKTLHIGWNGDMIICCTDDIAGEEVFGVVEKKGDLARLWNCERLNHIRCMFNNKFNKDLNNAPKPCQKCQFLAWLKPNKGVIELKVVSE